MPAVDGYGGLNAICLGFKSEVNVCYASYLGRRRIVVHTGHNRSNSKVIDTGLNTPEKSIFRANSRVGGQDPL